MVNGVDLGTRDQDGFSAADLAEYNGHHQSAKYLRTVENMVRPKHTHTQTNTQTHTLTNTHTKFVMMEIT